MKAAALILGLSLGVAEAQPSPWLLKSGQSFGPFPAKLTTQNVYRFIGKANTESRGQHKLELWPLDPNRTILLNFGARSQLHSLMVMHPSFWRLPGGLRVGSTIEQVESANGCAFQLRYSKPVLVSKGSKVGEVPLDLPHPVIDWNGGKLQALNPAKYEIHFGFHPNANRNTHVPSADYPSQAEQSHWRPREIFSSDDPLVRRMHPRIEFFVVNWPE